jgi:uncharacterized repeat protein (TIGR03847 family)
LSTSFDLPSPARVTIGAVGPPGQRVFYFQVRQGNQVVSLKLEKQQVLLLAGGLSEVLADLAAPSRTPDEGELRLEEPVEAEWSVGAMQLGYDSDADRIVLVAREFRRDAGEEDEEAVPGPDGGQMRVMLTREQAAGVVEHGKRLLSRGRPPCPLCGYPLEEDHSCPKTNGHRAPAL